MGVVAATLPARMPGLRFLACMAAAPLFLALARLLPADGAGLALRLLAAAVCVLIVPGALLLRSLAWPESPALAVAGSLALSLVVVFFALALVFAAEASLALALAVIVVVSLSAAVPAAFAGGVRFGAGRDDLLAVAAVAVAGTVFAILVWWVSRRLGDDGYFHAARAEKIDGLQTLYSVDSVDEFRHGGLHPGYAFPLWHGVLALVSRLAGVDVAVTVIRLSAVLVPLAFVLAYAVGRELFRSAAGGIAVATAQLALVGLGPGNTPGAYAFLSGPKIAAQLLLPAAILALAFAYVHGGSPLLLVPLAAGAFSLAAIHPTYAVFLAVPFAGFVAARLVLAQHARSEIRRLGAAFAALSVPPALFFVWLLPAVRDAASVTPTAAQRARDLADYAGFVDGAGKLLRLAPDAIARGGPAVVVALVAVPLAALAGRRLWAAYVLGGSLAGLGVLLLPLVFPTFVDAVSLSQARRLVVFLPLAFALAGAGALAGRLRIAGIVLAAALGAGVATAYPGEFSYRVREGGPGWAVWIAAVGGALALAVAASRHWVGPPLDWRAAAAVVSFAVAVGIVGIDDIHRQQPDRHALTPGLVAALRADVRPGEVLFGNVEAVYRAAAYVPAYIAAAPRGHVAVNTKNRPRERRLDVKRFFDSNTAVATRQELLESYGARWLLVDRSRHKRPELPGLERAYSDRHYTLYRVVE